ncbi:hypothetical protein BT63DRAFT_186947 [Microthyrium microscopicum]|uniref:Uncharacterized protein n=1 Tax=Microthyrium microscopicum TaxID=703497 RepID=A0A6A6UKR1_9PEZI|nr:hypothetical protein BT63DRAFT_186947 [Microthyrium microscopicum]
MRLDLVLTVLYVLTFIVGVISLVDSYRYGDPAVIVARSYALLLNLAVGWGHWKAFKKERAAWKGRRGKCGHCGSNIGTRRGVWAGLNGGENSWMPIVPFLGGAGVERCEDGEDGQGHGGESEALLATPSGDEGEGMYGSMGSMGNASGETENLVRKKSVKRVIGEGWIGGRAKGKMKATDDHGEDDESGGIGKIHV